MLLDSIFQQGHTLSSLSLGLMHNLTGLLLAPVSWALLGLVVLALYEIGLSLGERLGGIAKLVEKREQKTLLKIGKIRIERSDFIARLAPMLGLMGTLIPLGPGLAALGEGQLDILTTAITVAFDTTIIGLLVGMIGFVLGRMRRRWYDDALRQIGEHAHG